MNTATALVIVGMTETAAGGLMATSLLMESIHRIEVLEARVLELEVMADGN